MLESVSIWNLFCVYVIGSLCLFEPLALYGAFEYQHATQQQSDSISAMPTLRSPVLKGVLLMSEITYFSAGTCMYIHTFSWNRKG